MSKTKIIVLQMKELVYTGIFVGLGILLIVLPFISRHRWMPTMKTPFTSMEVTGLPDPIYTLHLRTRVIRGICIKMYMTAARTTLFSPMRSISMAIQKAGQPMRKSTRTNTLDIKRTKLEYCETI